MWFLSGVGNVPTPNMHSYIWDCVESYAIYMVLSCRLKIIPTSNLKLIISFLVLLILLLSFIKSLSIVALMQHAHLTLCTVLRLATGLVHVLVFDVQRVALSSNTSIILGSEKWD